MIGNHSLWPWLSVTPRLTARTPLVNQPGDKGRSRTLRKRHAMLPNSAVGSTAAGMALAQSQKLTTGLSAACSR